MPTALNHTVSSIISKYSCKNHYTPFSRLLFPCLIFAHNGINPYGFADNQ